MVSVVPAGTGDNLLAEETGSMDIPESDTFFNAEHPLMDRLNEALRKQLEKADQAVSLSLREKSESLERALKERERIGVELYGRQQQLAKFQMKLENNYAQFSAMGNMREEIQKALHGVMENCKKDRKQFNDKTKEFHNARMELDALNVSVSYIEEFNKATTDEILVTRRVAYASEDEIHNLEQAKQAQDLLINNINTQLKSMFEQAELFSSQFSAQLEETDASKAALRQTSEEMERIRAEAQDYKMKWASGLVGMNRRDVALQSAQEQLVLKKESIFSEESTISGLRLQIAEAQQDNERILLILEKIEDDYRIAQSNLDDAANKQVELEDVIQSTKKNIEAVDKTLKISSSLRDSSNSTIQNCEKQISKLLADKQAIEQSVLENMSDQTTIQQGAQNVYKLAKKLRSAVHESEISVGQLHNEISRIQVDSLNTEAHNTDLTTTRDAYEEELREKEDIIEKYERDMRVRNDSISKKQIYVDRLNKKYDTLTRGVEEENTGPLEATIKNITKEISDVLMDSSEAQRSWIDGQTELVQLVNTKESRNQEIHEILSRQTILKQKAARNEGDIKNLSLELRDLVKSTKIVHLDMNKLNKMIAKHREMRNDLEKLNYTLELDFNEILKEKEQMAKDLDSKVSTISNEKIDLLDDISDLERQALLWERKIQIEKETQEALDPEFGRREVESMRKEVNRMQSRFSKLERKQEQMLQEMEQTIGKRELISLRYQGGAKTTQSSLKKQLSKLRISLKESVKDCKRLDDMIQTIDAGIEDVNKELDEYQGNYNQIETNKMELNDRLQQYILRTEMLREDISRQQLRSRHFEKCIDGALKISSDSTEEYEKQTKLSANIGAALKDLSEDNPKHKIWLQRLIVILD
eukprot:13184_1